MHSYMAYQLKYDSAQGTCKADISSDGTSLIVNGKKITVNQELSGSPFSLCLIQENYRTFR